MTESAKTLTTSPASPLESLQKTTFSRRSALFGAAALLSTVAPRQLLAAVPASTAPISGPILLNSNENPYGPSPALP